MLSAGQPPLEAAPTPQGYAQRQALRQNQSQNQAHATMEVAGGQDNGQMQALIDQSRPRNADIDGIVDDGGGGGGGGGVGGGLSDQQRQPINLSQVLLLLSSRMERLTRSCFPSSELSPRAVQLITYKSVSSRHQAYTDVINQTNQPNPEQHQQPYIPRKTTSRKTYPSHAMTPPFVLHTLNLAFAPCAPLSTLFSCDSSTAARAKE